MIRINLLPHREIRRHERRRQFYMIAGLMVVAGAAVALLVHTVIAGHIDRQQRKNEIFKAEIRKLDGQIAEIRTLREQVDDLLARKQVIETLQSDRAEAVRLLGEITRRMPDGIYLKSVKQNGKQITLAGYAQSNARVSHLMRSLDESPYLDQSRLVEIKAATIEGRRVGEFVLNITIQQPKAQEGEGAEQ